MSSRAIALALDESDPLSWCRNEFLVPDEDLVYLDGNSLGRTPKSTLVRIRNVLEREWAGELIRSWEHWLDLPRQVGNRLGGIIGSRPGEVAVHDTTTVNLYQAIHIALGLRRERRVLAVSDHEFPTDRYVVSGIAREHGLEVRSLTDDTRLDDVAVIVRSVVDYKTAERVDVRGLTDDARHHGAVTVWDLSHAAGAIEFDVHELGVDLAVGCTYKFLNGGPGAPAWTYIAEPVLPHAHQPIHGWFAQQDQFDMDRPFRPHDDIRRVLLGTPHILSLVAADEGIALSARVGMSDIASKGRSLMAFAMDVIDHFELTTSTPRDPERRGCHVAIHHPEAARLVTSLASDHNVVADVRPPDIVRFGLSPLTTRFTDVWDGIERLQSLMSSR